MLEERKMKVKFLFLYFREQQWELIRFNGFLGVFPTFREVNGMKFRKTAASALTRFFNYQGLHNEIFYLTFSQHFFNIYSTLT
jgi:hypothetical protein